MQEKFKTILFDLDGTILDTAHSLTYALNELRASFNLPSLDTNVVREYAGKGVLPMFKQFLNLEESDVSEAALREQYLSIYRECMIGQTDFFDGMEEVLSYLDKNELPWGIVTNKHAWLTEPLLDSLSLTERAACLVCGDTLPQSKPDPAPMLYACQLMSAYANTAVYIGDSQNDIIAGSCSGMKTVLAAYGYLPKDVDHTNWNANHTITKPIELLEIL